MQVSSVVLIALRKSNHRGTGKSMRIHVATALSLLALCWTPGCSDGETPPASSGGATTGGDGGSGGAGGGGSGSGNGGAGGSGGATAACGETGVEVRSYSTNAQLANVPVVVTDATGAVIATQNSDDQGRACVKVPADGAVSALGTDADSSRIYTVVAPPEGATVLLRALGNDPIPPELTTYTMQVHALAGATSARIDTNCGTALEHAITPGNETFPAEIKGCPGPPGSTPEDILVYALGSDGAMLGWVAVLDAKRNPGATVDLGELTVDKTDTLSTTLTLTDVKPELGTPLLHAMGADSRIVIDAQASAATGMATLSVPAVEGLPWAYLLGSQGSLEGPTADGKMFRVTQSFQHLTRSVDWLPSVNASAASLAHPQQVKSKLDDPTHPELTWSWSSGTPGDVTHVSMTVVKGAARWSLDAVVPPDRTSLRFPDVPDMFATTHRPDGESFAGYQVVAEESDVITSYADAVGAPMPAGKRDTGTFQYDTF